METPQEHVGDQRDTLNEILVQIRNQKRELTAIFDTKLEEIQENFGSEVKRIKKEALEAEPWKKQGNKIQFNFNTGVLDNISQAKWGLENNKLDYVKEVLSEAEDNLKQRNKYIRIADTSEGGWETVKQYTINPIASGSEDEKRIFRADARAMRKKKAAQRASKAKKSRSYNDNGSGSSSFYSGAQEQKNRPEMQDGRPFQTNIGRRWGTCFACGSYDHFRKDCPSTKSATSTQTQPKQ